MTTLKQLAEAREKATKEKWHAPSEGASKYGFPRWHITAKDGDCLQMIVKVEPVGNSKVERQGNANFIALCGSTDFAKLAEQFEKMKSALEIAEYKMSAMLARGVFDPGEEANFQRSYEKIKKLIQEIGHE